MDRNRLAVLGAQAHATVLGDFSYDKYIRWFLALVDSVRKQPSRMWPVGRSLLPKLAKMEPADISRAVHGNREALKRLFIKLTGRPGVRWLYSYGKHIAQNVGKQS
jgi:hypothetical protein